MEKEQVKRDLRRLRNITHGINVLMRVKDAHERRLAYLRELTPPTPKAKTEIARICRNLSALRIEESIREATELESLYMGAISCLAPLDRIIILDGYVNGRSYQSIGDSIGYSERGVQRRVCSIIEKLATML